MVISYPMVQNCMRKLREPINSYFNKKNLEHTLRQPTSKPFDFLPQNVWNKVAGGPWSTPLIRLRVCAYDELHSFSAKSRI